MAQPEQVRASPPPPLPALAVHTGCWRATHTYPTEGRIAYGRPHLEAARLRASSLGDDVQLARDVRVALPERHERLEHLRRPVLLDLRVGDRLEPVAAEQRDPQSG